VNVSIYAIALGKRLGLTRNQLSELGTGALLHDLGKVKISLDVLHKDSSLTPQERALIEKHPVAGAKELIRTAGLSGLALRALIGCFEHHMKFDGSDGGYPRLRAPYQPHLVGRLVSIVDCFDAMTTKRVYRTHAMSRDKALSYMMSQSGSKFDPLLMRVFANMLGVYPIGTAVRLRSGRMAVVVSVSDDPAVCDRPVVRPITDEQGIQISRAVYPEIDLSKRTPAGDYPDEIVLALDAPAMGLDVSQYYA
jgi:HD-GYP domain-containing protein (c-di-GMP phosphodiesterase class II)